MMRAALVRDIGEHDAYVTYYSRDQEKALRDAVERNAELRKSLAPSVIVDVDDVPGYRAALACAPPNLRGLARRAEHAGVQAQYAWTAAIHRLSLFDPRAERAIAHEWVRGAHRPSAQPVTATMRWLAGVRSEAS
jgi:hypothetical protein